MMNKCSPNVHAERVISPLSSDCSLMQRLSTKTD